MLKRRVPLYVQIAAAMALGVTCGVVLGKDAAPAGSLGVLVIQLIKAIATPLLFFSIISAILKTEIEAKSGLRMVLFASCNAVIALAIGLTISNLLQPGRHLRLDLASGSGAPADASAYAGRRINFLETLAGYIPTNLVQPFGENLVITIVLLALLFGLALRRARSQERAEGTANYRVVEDGVSALLRVMEITLGWIITLIPLAVFGVVAKVVGEHGHAPLRGLTIYVVVGVGGLLVHVLSTHQAWVALYARIPLTRFWREAKEPVIYALGANSSLATLPVTLRALDRLGVSRASSTLGACVGTNFNNDGIILYEGMAVLFVAQASGIELSLADQALAAVSCMVAAMGVAGVPEAGIVSLSLVLNTVGLPVELLPLLLTVDWIVARCRSAANVSADMVLSIAVDGRRTPV